MAISPAELRELREASNVTQQELADALGKARSTIATWEGDDGNGVTKMNDILAVCNYFNIPVPGLSTDINEPDSGYHKAMPLNKDEAIEQRSIFAMDKYKRRLDEVPLTELMAEVLRRLDELEAKSK